MEKLHIEATKSSPKIDFDPATRILRIEGESYPENAIGFYKPAINWLVDYMNSESKPATLQIALTYINTSSTKALLTIFDILDEAAGMGTRVKVEWFYDPDDDILKEFGEDISEDLTIDFEIKEMSL